MKDIFKDPSIYYLIVIAIVSCITGVIAYNIAIRNRGSFVDTPDWTKVARRIIELIIVFVVLLFLCYMFFREWGLYFLLFSGIPIICCFITVGIVMKIIGWQNSNLIYKPEKPKNKSLEADYEKYINECNGYNNTVIAIEKKNRENLRNPESKKFKAINEHLMNTIILTLFIFSGEFIVFLTISMIIDKSIFALCAIVLNLLLSFEFSCLGVQLYYLIVTKQIPQKELIPIINIAKELND